MWDFLWEIKLKEEIGEIGEMGVMDLGKADFIIVHQRSR